MHNFHVSSTAKVEFAVDHLHLLQLLLELKGTDGCSWCEGKEGDGAAVGFPPFQSEGH